MWNLSEFKRHFKKVFSRDIDMAESNYVETILSVPFNFLWIAIKQSEIIIVKARNCDVRYDLYDIYPGESSKAAEIIARFPEIPNQLQEGQSVYGGRVLYALANQDLGNRFVSTHIHRIPNPDELEAWRIEFQNFLNTHVHACLVPNESDWFIGSEKPRSRKRQKKVVTSATDVTDLYLSVKARLALITAGIYTVGELMNLQETKLQHILSDAPDEVKSQVLDMRNELMRLLL